ncbi:MAG: hypothetical protein AAF149_23660 [Bacteroidota bacterium]
MELCFSGGENLPKNSFKQYSASADENSSLIIEANAYKVMKKLSVLSLIFLVVLSVQVRAQEQVIYPIQSKNSSYSGEGVQWILDRADSIQFLMFGEQHNVEGIAEFVDFMYNELHKKGVHYLVLETDGWTTQRSADLGVDIFTQKNPHSIAFDTNGDLQLMQSAIDLNPDIKTPIWGVDQMQTAIHPFHRLVEIANTSKQRRIARGAFLKSALKMGRYTRQDHQKDLDALEKVFSENLSKEKDQIIHEIRQTMEIFYTWMNPATRGESVANREALMGQNFDTYLGTAPDAKAVFKMGGAHTLYGIGPNGVPTFGDHVKKIANQKDQPVLSVSIYRYNPESTFMKDLDFGENKMLLIDCKAALFTHPEDSARLAQRDAIILLREAGYANKNINWAYEDAFKSGLIKRLIPLGLGLLIGLITIITFLIGLIKGKKRLAFPALASLLALGLVAFQLVQILDANASATISTGYLPTALHLLFSAASLAFIYAAFKVFRSEGSLLSKLYYVLFTVSFAVLSYQVYYWNIGGMFGA